MGRRRQKLTREEVSDLIAKKLDINPERVAMSQAIRKFPDGYDSLDIVELVMELEKEFGQNSPSGLA
jgi:acyl carrier protein